MHLRLFGKPIKELKITILDFIHLLTHLVHIWYSKISELAKDGLCSKGINVLGGVISPVNDAYQKKGM